MKSKSKLLKEMDKMNQRLERAYEKEKKFLKEYTREVRQLKKDWKEHKRWLREHEVRSLGLKG